MGKSIGNHSFSHLINYCDPATLRPCSLHASIENIFALSVFYAIVYGCIFALGARRRMSERNLLERKITWPKPLRIKLPRTRTN